MSIEWERQAWDDVSRETIVKCFKRTGLYPDEFDEDDPFELMTIILKISSFNSLEKDIVFLIFMYNIQLVSLTLSVSQYSFVFSFRFVCIRGGNSHMKQTGMLVVSLRGRKFWILVSLRVLRAKRQYFKPPKSRLGFREETQNYVKRKRSQIFFLTCFVYRIIIF